MRFKKRTFLAILIMFCSALHAQQVPWQMCDISACSNWNFDFIESQGKLFSTSCISNDSGSTWIPSGGGYPAFLSYEKNSTGIFAGTDSVIALSTDNGTSWNQVYTSGYLNFIFDLAVLNDSIYAATRTGGVVMTPDNGVNWISSNNGLPTDSTFCILVSGTVMYVGLSGHGVYRSTDSGQNWVSSNIGLPANSSIRSLVDDGIILYASTNTGLYVSWDTGITWNLSNYPGPHPVNLLAVDNVVLAGGVNPSANGGLFRTLDHGLTWTLYSNGLNNQCSYVVGALYASPTHIFCGMGESMCMGGQTDIFRIDRGLITTGLPAYENISQASVQVYPNPFSEFVYVSTQDDSMHNLRIFDLANREILKTNFTKSVSVSTSELPAGFYFYEVSRSGVSNSRGVLVKR